MYFGPLNTNVTLVRAYHQYLSRQSTLSVHLGPIWLSVRFVKLRVIETISLIVWFGFYIFIHEFWVTDSSSSVGLCLPSI